MLNQQDPHYPAVWWSIFNYINKERLKKLADIEAAVQRLDRWTSKNKPNWLLGKIWNERNQSKPPLMKPRKTKKWIAGCK